MQLRPPAHCGHQLPARVAVTSTLPCHIIAWAAGNTAVRGPAMQLSSPASRKGCWDLHAVVPNGTGSERHSSEGTSHVAVVTSAREGLPGPVPLHRQRVTQQRGDQLHV
jgi:hypothetical protein